MSTTTNMNTTNPYEVYNIGDTFHNNNGDDYIIINISKARDKALLVKPLKGTDKKYSKSGALFIGAKGLNMHDWCHGHYFMENFAKAVEWFETDDMINEKPKLMTVEDMFKICITYNGGCWFKFVIRKINDVAKESLVYDLYSEIPNDLKKGYVVEWDVISWEKEINSSDFQVPYFTIYLDLKYNPELRPYYDSYDDVTWR